MAGPCFGNEGAGYGKIVKNFHVYYWKAALAGGSTGRSQGLAFVRVQARSGLEARARAAALLNRTIMDFVTAYPVADGRRAG
jgi:hypothetical protein